MVHRKIRLIGNGMMPVPAIIVKKLLFGKQKGSIDKSLFFCFQPWGQKNNTGTMWNNIPSRYLPAL